MMKRKISVILFFICISCIVFFSFSLPEKQYADVCKNKEWETQLNEMNHLIILISSVNIINGLYFSDEQAGLLKNYSAEFSSANLPGLDTTGSVSDDLVKIRRVYVKLLELLLNKDSIPEAFKKQVYDARILEAEIIKKSILGADKRGNKDDGCMQCHCIPAYFPKGDVSKMETKSISAKERVEIDKAHTIGLFGESGMLKLWLMKDKTDSVLSEGQRYIMKNFRCCLIPPGDLKDPTNIGQAFVSNEWINYFRSIKKMNDAEWKIYKDYFVLPLDTLLRASLPGISSKDIKEKLSKAEAVIDNVRSLDDIDFELQKENICKRMKEALSVNPSVNESAQEADVRKFVSAMFLLFPGSEKLYSNLADAGK